MKKIFILSIYESGSLVHLRSYIPSRTDSMFGYMLFGLPITKGRNTVQEIFFVDSSGKKVTASLSVPFQLKDPWYSLMKFLVHWYAFFMLLRITRHTRYDVCIAETPNLGAVLWLFKKMRRCRLTIFHVTDVFSLSVTTILDACAVALQKLLRTLSYKNDVVWYMQDNLRTWDNNHGFISERFFTAGDSFDYHEALRFSKVKRYHHHLCYIGRMDKRSGLDIAIKAVKYIKKRIPDVHFTVIGGYSEHDCLPYKTLAQREGVADAVQFLGYVSDLRVVHHTISHSALGMAIYAPENQDDLVYSFSGKVADYIQMGTPVVLTKNGPPIRKEIKKYGAGILVDYDVRDTARAIIEVFSDSARYKNLQAGVLALTRNLRHEVIQSDIYKKITDSYNALYTK